MKKLFFILLVISGLKSAAQTFEGGLGFQIYSMPGTILETMQNDNYSGPHTYSRKIFAILPTLDLHASFNFPLIDRPGYAFGIQPGVLVNGMLRVEGLFLGTREDLHLTWRVGSNASYANFIEAKRYYGIGIGPSLYTVFTYVGDVYTDKILFVRPSISLSTGIEHHSFKIFVQLWPYESYYRAYTGNIPKIKYWQFGFSWERWGFLHGD